MSQLGRGRYLTGMVDTQTAEGWMLVLHTHVYSCLRRICSQLILKLLGVGDLQASHSQM